MQTELNKYAQAFGEMQAEWIDSVILPALNPIERFLLLNRLMPVAVQRWVGRHRKIAIVRSLISGGHGLTITKGGRVIGYSEFKLTQSGWIRQETK